MCSWLLHWFLWLQTLHWVPDSCFQLHRWQFHWDNKWVHWGNMTNLEPSISPVMFSISVSHLNKRHCHHAIFGTNKLRLLDSSTFLMLSSVALWCPKTSTLKTHPKFMCTFYPHSLSDQSALIWCLKHSIGILLLLSQLLTLDNTLSTHGQNDQFKTHQAD